jgi:hypothetical protein
MKAPRFTKCEGWHCFNALKQMLGKVEGKPCMVSVLAVISMVAGLGFEPGSMGPKPP